MLGLAGCPKLPVQTAIGPYTQFSGRLVVIEPARRWQVMMNWHAERSHQGWLRLAHVASSRVVELRWRADTMQLRDNQAASTVWRTITEDELISHGIMLQPAELATFLLGGVPHGLRPTAPNRWEGRRGRNHIKVEWNDGRKRLAITDITHGRRAILIIHD